MLRELIDLIFRDPQSSILILSGLIFILLAIAREINVFGQVITINLFSSQVRLIVGIGGLILFLYGIYIFPHNSKAKREGIPCIGISMITITPDIAKQENLNTNKGVWIVGVTPNSPAEKSGLLKNDLIVKLDNNVIENKEQIQMIVNNFQEKKVLQTIIIRDKNMLKIPVFPACWR